MLPLRAVSSLRSSVPLRTEQARRKAPIFSAADFAGELLHERQWIVENLIPCRNVTDLSADGGTGKSLLALQLLVGVACTGNWVGMPVATQGPAIYFSAEDERREIHLRLRDICASEGVEFSALEDLHIMPLSDEDATLANFDSKNGMAETALLGDLEGYVEEIEPRLIVIDTRADVFGGDEIKRHQVRAFVSRLRRLATKNDMAVILLSHPSLTGMGNGTGQSGSTGWGNSVRSRLYFESDPDDADLRTLSTKKMNYGPCNTSLRVRWVNGVFIPATSDAAIDSMVLTAAEEKFIELLVWHFVSPAVSPFSPIRLFRAQRGRRHVPQFQGYQSRLCAPF